MEEENKYYKGCYVPEEDFLKYCKDVKRKSYYGFKSDEVKIILPNNTVVSPKEYWKSKEKKKGRWKPEKGDKYCYMGGLDKIYWNFWANSVVDNYLYSINNMFKTEKEAEEHRKKLIYQQQYRDYALEHNEEIDWENCKQDKYKAFYDHLDKKIRIEANQNWMSQAVYFTNEQDIWDFIKLIREDNFKKYILEVEE